MIDQLLSCHAYRNDDECRSSRAGECTSPPCGDTGSVKRGTPSECPRERFERAIVCVRIVSVTESCVRDKCHGLFPTIASGAWRPASPRSLPGTTDKTGSGFDKP